MPGTVCLCDQFQHKRTLCCCYFHCSGKSSLCDVLWEGKETYRILPILSFYLTTWLCPYYITIVKLSHEPCNKSYHSCMLYPTSPSAGFLNVNKALGITETTPLDSGHTNLFLARPNSLIMISLFYTFLSSYLKIDTGLVYLFLNAGD